MLWNFSLSRAEEMILGVSFPALCLLVSEIHGILRGRVSNIYAKYAIYKNTSDHTKQVVTEPTEEEKKDNDFSIKVIRIGVIISGLLVCMIGIVASNGRVIVTAAGLLLVLVGFLIGKKRGQVSHKKLNHGNRKF
jgi:hypothetical protein